MSVEELKQMLEELDKMYETGLIGEHDYEYQYEHYKMQLHLLTDE